MSLKTMIEVLEGPSEGPSDVVGKVNLYWAAGIDSTKTVGEEAREGLLEEIWFGGGI